MTDSKLVEKALNQPLAADEFKPVDLHLDRKDGLKIKWKDGQSSHFPLALLRKMCPCATCRIERDKGPSKPAMGTSLNVLPANIDKATEFSDAARVGNYALNIIWADGHRTGIYDFRYLRLLADEMGE